jgi:hypothetical protein
MAVGAFLAPRSWDRPVGESYEKKIDGSYSKHGFLTTASAEVENQDLKMPRSGARICLRPAFNFQSYLVDFPGDS